MWVGLFQGQQKDMEEFLFAGKVVLETQERSLSNGILTLALLVLSFFLLIKLVLRFSLGWCFENFFMLVVHCVRC